VARPSAPGAAPGETGDLFSRLERADPKPLSVGELTRALKRAIEPAFRDVWVAGEVANLRRQASGHVYFSLKDADATINAVLWSSAARGVRFKLEEGQEVLVRGFAGDDVTDEDAFALGPPLVFGVHVGPGASLAEWRLRSQDDIERLFELLLEVRERPARGPRARRAPGELVGGEK
jgi:hypothetical protein